MTRCLWFSRITKGNTAKKTYGESGGKPCYACMPLRNVFVLRGALQIGAEREYRGVTFDSSPTYLSRIQNTYFFKKSLFLTCAEEKNEKEAEAEAGGFPSHRRTIMEKEKEWNNGGTWEWL